MGFTRKQYIRLEMLAMTKHSNIRDIMDDFFKHEDLVETTSKRHSTDSSNEGISAASFRNQMTALVTDMF
jgi:hypothetical protein